jgi:hypothetical protein
MDDPVSMYIPEFSYPQVVETVDDSDTTWTARPAGKLADWCRSVGILLNFGGNRFGFHGDFAQDAGRRDEKPAKIKPVLFGFLPV